MAIAVAEAARAHGLAIVLLPAAYHRAGWDGGDLPPSPGQRRFCDPDVGDLPGARRRAARLGGGARRRARRRRRAQHARGPRGVAGGDRGLRGRARARAPRPRPRAAARAGGVPRRARRLADRAAAPHRLPRPAHEPDPRHPRRRRATSRGSAESRTIVVSCPTTEGSLGDGHFPALVYRDAGVRIADRQRLQRARGRVRGGARARDARPARAPHPPRAAGRLRRPLGRAGGERPREPRAGGRGHGHASTATIRTWPASPTPTCRSPWRPAPRPRS